MNELFKELQNLKKSPVKKQVNSRIKEFDSLGKKSNKFLFSELCFCILTANFNAARSIEIQQKMHPDFISLPEKQLAKKLKVLGHRFPNTRANYIFQARAHKNDLKKLISSKNEFEVREFLVKNVKGLGLKESGHFLRNIGFSNLAILDFHILDLLAKHKLIKKPKNLNKKTYFEIESLLASMAAQQKLTLAELDLYLWFLETGKVLK